jgi:integrase
MEATAQPKSYEVAWKAHGLFLGVKMAAKTTTKNYSKFGYVRKLGTYKFQAQYTYKGKTYYSKGIFGTKTEASNWLTMEQSFILQGTWSDPKKPTALNTESPKFGEYALQHIDLQNNAQGKGLKPSTKAKYLDLLRNQLKQFQAVPVNEITKFDVDKWWAGIRNSGKLTSGSKAYKLMHAVMGRAIGDGIIASNPCQIKGAQNASSKKPLFTPSMEQVASLAEDINPRFRTLIYVCAYGGLRFGEVTALTRKDFKIIQFEDKKYFEISVTDGVTFVEKKFIVGTPKSEKGVREVLLNANLTSLVANHLEGMGDKSPNALVFPAANGHFLRNDVLAKAIKASHKRLGVEVKGFTPHSLRRAGATELQNNGANIAEVQEFLGDASPAAALSYVKTTTRKRQLIDQMNVTINLE